MPARKRKPEVIGNPVEFWLAQHEQARVDADRARKTAPSVVPQHIKLAREAWREYKSAIAAAEMPAPAAGSDPATPPKPPAEGSLEAELAKVQRLQRAAEAAGSYVAAQKLLGDEREVGDRIRARNEEALKAARKGMTPDELVGALVARLSAMPAAMQERVRSALGWT
jgi:hypothetical protein